MVGEVTSIGRKEVVGEVGGQEKYEGRSSRRVGATVTYLIDDKVCMFDESLVIEKLHAIRRHHGRQVVEDVLGK